MLAERKDFKNHLVYIFLKISAFQTFSSLWRSKSVFDTENILTLWGIFHKSSKHSDIITFCFKNKCPDMQWSFSWDLSGVNHDSKCLRLCTVLSRNHHVLLNKFSYIHGPLTCWALLHWSKDHIGGNHVLFNLLTQSFTERHI